jgi:Mn-dependent DtxR family transcriptional regulator
MSSKKKQPSSSGVQKVLAAIYELKVTHGFDDGAPTKRVASIAQISNATFPSLICRMIKKGLIERVNSSSSNNNAGGGGGGGGGGTTIKITELGMEQVIPIDIPTSNEEAQQKIKEKLKGNKPRRIFDYLCDGKPHKKSDIMVAIDCTNPSTFAPMMSRYLKKHGYIEYPKKGMVQLTDVCFPFGRDIN